MNCVLVMYQKYKFKSGQTTALPTLCASQKFLRDLLTVLQCLLMKTLKRPWTHLSRRFGVSVHTTCAYVVMFVSCACAITAF